MPSYAEIASYPIVEEGEHGPGDGDPEEEDEEDPSDNVEQKLTESQKRLVMKVHVNTGHPSEE